MEKLSPDALNHLPPTSDESGLANPILILATQNKALDLVTTILSKGVNPNVRNKNNECALHYATYTDSFDFEIAAALVSAGCSPEVVEKQVRSEKERKRKFSH